MATAAVPRQFTDPVEFILHPTDFSQHSERAFAHALRLALANKASLTLLHVGDDPDREWDKFPAVRGTLQRWGLLDAAAQRADVAKLGITIEKVIVRNPSVVDAIADYGLNNNRTDLLVMATDQRRGLSRWFEPSKAESTARKLALPALFVPGEGRGCVDPGDGRVTMKQVLIPVDHQPPAGAAIERGLRAIAAFGDAQSKLTLLHVGPEGQFPDVQVPKGPWNVERVTRPGQPVTEILAAAGETEADLLILVTKGTDGFLDAFRGTTTEQVLRHAPCPVLSIPADSFD